MDSLYINGTEISPKVTFDVKKNIFELSGISRPEDVVAFYDSIIFKVENYINGILKNHPNAKGFKFDLKFDLIYMNSASSKYILQILDIFKRLLTMGANINIDWYYEDPDDQIYEDGEDLSDVIKMPFNLIARK